MSDDPKVIDFNGLKKKRDMTQAYQCACGSQSFYLIDGGDIQCRSCEEVKKPRWIDPSKKS